MSVRCFFIPCTSVYFLGNCVNSFFFSFRVTCIFRLVLNVGAESVFFVSGNVHAGTTKFAGYFFSNSPFSTPSNVEWSTPRYISVRNSRLVLFK